MLASESVVTCTFIAMGCSSENIIIMIRLFSIVILHLTFNWYILHTVYHIIIGAYNSAWSVTSQMLFLWNTAAIFAFSREFQLGLYRFKFTFTLLFQILCLIYFILVSNTVYVLKEPLRLVRFILKQIITECMQSI